MPAINKTKGSADRIKMKIRKGAVSYTHLTLPTKA